MENTKFEWVENKLCVLIENIGIIIFLVLLATSAVFIFINHVLMLPIFLSGFVIGGLCLALSKLFSSKNDYTKLFFNRINNKIKNVKTKQELEVVYNYLKEQSFDKNGNYRLSYIEDFTVIITDIRNKLEILKQLNIR